MKVLAMPPPTINWSTLPTSEDSSSSLVADLAAGDDGQQRSRRVGQRLVQRIELGHQQRTAGGLLRESDRAMGGGLRAVRGAEGVHDEHVAQRGVLASTAASSSLPSPTFMRQFSSSTSWPGCTSRHPPSRAPAAPRNRAVPTAAPRPAPANRPRSTRLPSDGRDARSPSPPRLSPAPA
jgi:hypothetical protein